MYFLTFFFNISTLDTDTVFVLLQPPLERHGKVVFGQGSAEPLPFLLELAHGES